MEDTKEMKPAEAAKLATTEGGGALHALAVKAVESGNIEMMERVEAMMEREAERMRKAEFVTALARAQKNFKPVKQSGVNRAYKKVRADGTEGPGRYPTFNDVKNAVDDALEAEGIGYRFNMRRGERDEVTMVCILWHVNGYEVEAAEFHGVPDDGGKKNRIQQRGSGRTYGKRYALMDALGIEGHEDDDGAGAEEPPEPVSEEQAIRIRDCLDAARDKYGDRWEQVRSRFFQFALGDSTARMEDVGQIPAHRFPEIEAKFREMGV